MMRGYLFFCAAVAAAMPATAWADDPTDPAMQRADARARDREMTRQLNLDELARVRKRDARTVRTSDNRAAHEEYSARSRDYERNMANYNDSRARYEREKAAWQRAVAACRAGDYSACD